MWHGNEKLRYVAVGLWNTAFGYAAFLCMYGLFHGYLHYLIISVLAHLIAVANAFMCQRILVFRSKTSWGPAFVRFGIAQLLVLMVSVLGLALLVEVFYFDPLIAQLLVMSVCVIAGYLLNRGFSFNMGKS